MARKVSGGLSTQDITFAAAGIALMAVSAWVTVPLGPVPFTLQTMALAFLVLALNPRQQLVAVLCYLLIGAVGLPVFSGMRGGVGVLFGPTGGFLLGFALAAVIAYVVRRNVGACLGRDVAIVVASIACSYGVGWAWLTVSASMSPAAAFMAACAPFVMPDALKCAAGVVLASAVRRAIPSLSEARR